jgi:hypothetical protein
MKLQVSVFIKDTETVHESAKIQEWGAQISQNYEVSGIYISQSVPLYQNVPRKVDLSQQNELISTTPPSSLVLGGLCTGQNNLGPIE